MKKIKNTFKFNNSQCEVCGEPESTVVVGDVNCCTSCRSLATAMDSKKSPSQEGTIKSNYRRE